MSREAKQVRRVRVERGIYKSPATGRYEFCYQDSDGRVRWQTAALVDGKPSLKGARAERGAILDKLSKGVKVAPSSLTLGKALDDWYEQRKPTLRTNTQLVYEAALPRIKRHLGRKKLSAVDADAIADLIGKLRAEGLAEGTIAATLAPLSAMLGRAARKGKIPANPVKNLEQDERPHPEPAEMRVLEADEIARLLDAADDRYRILLATAVTTGLRQGEILGLQWGDLTLPKNDSGELRVRRQMGRDRKPAPPKTKSAVREVPLPRSLVRMLREHRERALADGLYGGPKSLVFCGAGGQPLNYRSVSRYGLDQAVRRAHLNEPRLRFHDLRHTAASLLIAGGANVVYVSRILGHASPSTTLDVYSHLWAKHEHAETAIEAMEKALSGKAAESSGSERRRTEPTAEPGNVRELAVSASGSER